MKLSPRIVVWFQAFVVIGCLSVLKAETAPGTYTAKEVHGAVTWINPATKVEAPLKGGQKLPQGAIVTTNENASVVLVFANGATATLAPDTSIEISRFYQQSFTEEAFLNEALEPSVSVTEMNLIRGEMIGKVRRLRTGSEFVINTPVGAAGVRGTEYSVSYNPKTKMMTIKTASGLVVYKGKDGHELPVPGNKKYEHGVVTDLTPEERARIIEIANAAVSAALETQNGDDDGRGKKVITVTIKDTDEISPAQP